MSIKPKVPCKKPGCPELVEAGKGYCEKHMPKRVEAWRPSATKRGYDKKWERARQRFLETHPLCAECLKEGKFVRATDVDHIIPHKGNMKLFWDVGNWQALCHSCHSKKTFSENHRQKIVSNT